jgi:thermostable 8-oxoguanine DNA glycosylase
LCKLQPPEVEREVAEFLSTKLRGIGLKQSRNLLQMLGLTRYEIPLDSRVVKWLNGIGFPFGREALSDPRFYTCVLDLIRELCDRAGTYPCVLDAAIFVSFDPEGSWTEATF